MKKFSKSLSMIMIAALIVTGFTGFTGNEKISAAETGVKVYVTISDEIGLQVVKQKGVEVSDVDEDGEYTIYDALYCAHEKYFTDGADGFAVQASDYGPFITKLWGVENGGWYQYRLNDGFVYSMLTPIADGDKLNAYCYVDLENGSDAYSFFDKRVASVREGKTLKLKLMVEEYDADYNLNLVPLEGANVTVNGKDTGLVTDKNGNVKIKTTKCGSLYISATDSYKTIVSPACVVFVQPKKGETIKVKKAYYTVTKLGKVETDKKGKVTFSKSANEGKKAPKTIEYAGVTYKVKVVD